MLKLSDLRKQLLPGHLKDHGPSDGQRGGLKKATLGTVETQFLYGKKHMVPIESHSILGMNSAKHQE